MCGIAGIISLDGTPIQYAEHKAKKMQELLRHRGPNSKGFYLSENSQVLLVNTRLSIVDVNNKYKLPFESVNKQSVLAYNGEVFEHTVHKNNLEKKGIKFITHSDTEVLIESLNYYGVNCLDTFDGFWGFAYYDIAKNEVMLNRDLFGKKQIFYYKDKHRFIFASEINPILEILEHNFSVDYQSVISSFRFRCAPQGTTLLKEVRKMLPGELITIQLGQYKVNQKIALKFNPDSWLDYFKNNPSEIEVFSEFKNILHQSCKRRMPNEVGYMSTLSGGIDSTLMNIYFSKISQASIKTVFGRSTRRSAQVDKEADEVAASYFTSKMLGTKHHVFEMLDDRCASDYQAIAGNSFDGVLCEGLVSFYQVAREVRSLGSRVLMLSDGPDEYFTGYTRDIEAISMLEAQNNLGKFNFRTAHGGSREQDLSQIFNLEFDMLGRNNTYGSIPDIYQSCAVKLDACQRMALSYVSRTMPDYYNLRTDRATMLSSIELRLPFQTRDLIEFAIALPKKWRLDNQMRGKYLMRQVVEEYVGPEISRRAKHGFAYPAWMDKKISDNLRLSESILDSNIFSEMPFKNSAQKIVFTPGNERYIWMTYCLVKTFDRLKNRDFSMTKNNSAVHV